MKGILLMISLLLLSGCASSDDVNPFFIKTDDGVKLSVNYFPTPEESDKGVVLLHMLSKDKSDWDSLVSEFTSNRYHVIAIDMRGHGESEGNWQDFTEDDFRKMVLDLKAATDYLEDKKVTRIGIVGASIGANLALKHAAQEDNVNSVILLSPSLNYRGIETEQAMMNYKNAYFIVTSKDDKQSADDSLTLFEMKDGTKQLHMFDSAGHGTAMFSDPTLKDMVLEWLRKTV